MLVTKVPKKTRLAGGDDTTKASTEGAKSSKPVRVSREEATQKFLDATIALLEKKPIPDISLHEIAEATGLNHGYVFRYFGTRLDLFAAVTDELARLATQAGVEELRRRKEAGEDPLALNLSAINLGRVHTNKRQKVMQYLVSCGVPPARFATQSRALISVAQNQLETMGMHPRMAQAQAVKIIVLIWANDYLLDIFGISAEESADVLSLTLDEISNHKATTKRVGWK